MAGNAVINQVNTLSGLLGPVIGGKMFGMWGIYPILSVSIVCFLFSAIMEIFIHIPHVKRPRETSVLNVVKMDLRESYQFVRNEKPIFFSIVFLVSIFNLVLSAVMIVWYSDPHYTSIKNVRYDVWFYPRGTCIWGTLWRHFDGDCCSKIKTQKFVSSSPCLFYFRCANGYIPAFEYAPYYILWGYYFDEFCCYGSLYTVYGADLYYGTNTNSPAVSW